MPTRIQIAKKDIVALFGTASKKVYSFTDLAKILAENRSYWRLAQTFTRQDFIDFLIQKSNLKKITLKSEEYPPLVRYVWGEANAYQIALSLQRHAYLSHGTAVFLHALNDQIPNVIYVNYEQRAKPRGNGTLSQQAIDRAFAGHQRQSNYIFSTSKTKIVVVNGKQTGGLEVGQLPGPDDIPLSVTKLERTLIDIAVRPAYAGGAFQVLEAYKRAKDRISVNTLVATLKKLDYIYPYHQVIGFYMERSGYEESRLAQLSRIGIHFDFYLTYGLRDHEHDSKWRLFYPKGM